MNKILPLTLAAACFFALNVHAEFRQFELTIEEVDLEVAPGFSPKVWAFNGQVPAPLMRVKEGDEIEVTVFNNTTLTHTIHWHGIYQTGTWQMDGVPEVTQPAIEPGDSFVYRFVANKTGSLWYHCHVNTAEHIDLRGMWGALIVDPKEPTELEKEVTKEAVLFFSSWDSSVAYTYGENAVPGRELDYFSINGKSHPYNQPLRVKEGDVLRMRLYAPTSPVAFHLHGHDVLITHKDGTALPHPYWADVVPIQPGERYDIIVRMNNPGIWMVHDHIEENTTAGGKEMGGTMMVVEYEGIEKPDFYMWKDVEFEPDFYMSESLAKPHGLHDIEVFKGVDPTLERRPRTSSGHGH
ncbi:MAG: multicopper oxidase domain-containing protein [Porticoccaceae bacterium]|nr:multicopper oxidase domain-containing protein [Porticoccaceae bacterium]